MVRARRRLWLLPLGLLALFLTLGIGPDRSRLNSREEALALLDRVHVKWQRPGPPVVVFFGPGCGDCDNLQRALDREGVPYETVDGITAPSDHAVLVALSRNRLGRPVRPVTPTTLVGTCVVRGDHPRAVVRAYLRQHDWPLPGRE